MQPGRLVPWLMLACALPLAATASDDARIPFANLGGIQDWRAADDDTLYIQGRTDQWYRAELLGPCVGLDFATTIGFEVQPTGTFDEFSSVIVDGRRCALRTFVEVAGPPDESARARGRMARAEEPLVTEGNERAPEVALAMRSGAEADAAQVSIPFADLGGIRSYQASSNDALLLEGRNDQWYRAELFGPCPGLQFDDAIGFVLEPSGRFDRFSSIIVDGQRCSVRSLTRTAEPTTRAASAPEEPR